MKFKNGLIALPILCLCSCANGTYKEVKDFSEELVTRIKEAYSERVYSNKENAKNVTLKSNLGIFNETTYVNILSYNSDTEIVAEVVTDYYLNNKYFCSLPNPSYCIEVYIDGEGSYKMQDAYDAGKITNQDVRYAKNRAKDLGFVK